MAATGLSRRFVLRLACAAAAASRASADDTSEIHQCVSAIALALSGGDVAQAMLPFSKSYAEYAKLSSYFEALAGAYSLESQVDFTGEEVSGALAELTIRWALTLTTRQDAFTKTRTGDLSIKLNREGKRWRITAFSPLDIFNPEGQP